MKAKKCRHEQSLKINRTCPRFCYRNICKGLYSIAVIIRCSRFWVFKSLLVLSNEIDQPSCRDIEHLTFEFNIVCKYLIT